MKYFYKLRFEESKSINSLSSSYSFCKLTYILLGPPKDFFSVDDDFFSFFGNIGSKKSEGKNLAPAF